MSRQWKVEQTHLALNKSRASVIMMGKSWLETCEMPNWKSWEECLAECLLVPAWFYKIAETVWFQLRPWSTGTMKNNSFYIVKGFSQISSEGIITLSFYAKCCTVNTALSPENIWTLHGSISLRMRRHSNNTFLSLRLFWLLPFLTKLEGISFSS